MEKIRVIDVARPNKIDINLDLQLDVAVIDGHVKRCVAAITETLKSTTSPYSELQRVHLSWMFDAFGFTHDTIRYLLRPGGTSPSCVDALALARLQLEALYSVCLMVEDPTYVDTYVKSFWRDNYVRFLLVREECKNLPRFDDYLNQTGLQFLEMFRAMAGVTDEEKAFVEADELSIPMPVGIEKAKIPKSRTPGGVLEKITDPDRKRMLMRLYPEYQRLCSFAHGSTESAFFKAVFSGRSIPTQNSSASQRQSLFERQVLDPALLHSLLAVTQSSCEVSTLYPADIDLKRTVIEAWNLLSEINLLGQTIWEIRARSLLGVVQS